MRYDERMKNTANARRERKKQLGLCVQCPRKAVVGKTLCAVCLEKMRAKTKIRLRKLKESGICARCRAQTETGRTMCRPCLELSKIDRKKRIASGCCPYCRCTSVPGKSICPSCSERRRRESNRKRAAGICVSLGCRNTLVPGKVNCQTCINKRSEKLRQLKQTVLNHYGQRCNCPCGCTVTNFRHLTIDHRNNDGSRQRKAQGIHGGHANYRIIIKAGFPDDLQVLCFNCNCAKAFYGGCQ